MNKKEIGIIIIFILIVVAGFCLNRGLQIASIGEGLVQEQETKIDWVSPTGHKDEGNHYSAAYRVYDDAAASKTKTYTYWNNDWCPFLELTHEPIVCNRIRYYNYVDISAYYDRIDVDVFHGGKWHDVYEGDFEVDWVEKGLSGGAQVVEKARIRQHTRGNRRCYLYEFDFGEVEKVSLLPLNLATLQEQQTASVGGVISNFLTKILGF